MRNLRSSGRHFLQRSQTWLLALAALSVAAAGQSGTPAPATGVDSEQSAVAPVTITLQDALQRAQRNSPDLRAALTELGIAREDRVVGRAGLLPSVNYNTSLIYTQGNGTRSNAPAFIANNGVHEYISQGNVHQVFSLTAYGDFRKAAAAEALAKARAEIAARGLVVTVVQAYYGLVVAQRKYGTEQLAAEEARRFLDISQKLEKGGEVAHSDVIKGRIQYEQQERDLQEARLGMEKSRLELSVLLFPDFNQNYTVVDDLQMPVSLPQYPEVQAMAARKNPELRAAAAALEVANHQVTSAVSNLGSSIVGSIQIPIWSWGASVSKLKQANLRRGQARVELTYAQRKILSDLRAFYSESETARSELESLNQSAELAAESLRLTNMRYQAGESTVLEVVDAQNTLTQARNAYADGQSRYRLALATLEPLTGTF